MDGLDSATTRDTYGRFVPGSSGNPAGKKPGTVHKATALKIALRDGETEAVARVIIEKALAGSVTAARFLMDRIEPKPRGRPIDFMVEDSTDIGQLLDAAFRDVATGGMSVDEALDLLRFIKGARDLRPPAARDVPRAVATEPPRPRATPARPTAPAAPAFHLHSAGGAPLSRRSDLLSSASRTAITAATGHPPRS